MKRQINKVKQILYATLFLTMITVVTFVTVITAKAVIAPVTYVIYRDVTTIYAQNGQTGVNDYSGADAATVIRSAIDALPATTGGEIVIKGGTYNTYNITSNFMSGVTKPVTLILNDTTFSVSGVTLTVETKHRIIGAGRGRTVFNFSNTGAVDGFKVIGWESELKGFTVDMQNIGTGRGIFVNSFMMSRMEQIEVARSGGVGILFQSAPGLNVHRSFARDIVTRNNASHGWHVQTPSGGTGNDQFVIEMLNSADNGGQGIRLETNVDGQKNSMTTYTHARPQNNAGDGVSLIGDQGIVFISLESEGNGGWGFNTSLGGAGSQKVNSVWLIDAFFGANTLGTINIPPTTATNILLSEYGTSLRLPQLRAFSDDDVTIPLIMRRSSASATGDLLQAQAENSTPMFRIKSNGKLSSTTTSPVYVTTESTGMVNFVVERITGQTADLQQWSNEYGGVLASINNNGSLRTQGISKTSTPANNLSGQATLNAGIGSLVITFPTAEPDASYYIQLTGNGNNVLWVTNKTTTGFTINRSSTTGTRIVDWLLVR